MNKRPMLLDLFCGAGGAAMGYYRAGFDIVGVDIKPQPHFPFRFIQADALEYLAEHGREFDVIHASPPCQAFSVMRRGRWQDRKHPDLLTPTRDSLDRIGKPYVIENVVGAPLINPVMLCGTLFGLQTKAGSQLRRNRLFEIHPPLLVMTPQCLHATESSVIGVYGGGQHPQRRKYPSTIGVFGHAGGTSKRDYPDMDCFSTNDRRDAMGIDWMTGKELSQAIPPAYTEFIGKKMMEIIP